MIVLLPYAACITRRIRGATFERLIHSGAVCNTVNFDCYIVVLFVTLWFCIVTQWCRLLLCGFVVLHVLYAIRVHKELCQSRLNAL